MEQSRNLGLGDSLDIALVPSSGNYSALQTLGPWKHNQASQQRQR